ncbi:hypothetical protein ELI_0896 [Eubacterium callanderi]|uniref:Uncharacterized protein n=1 Tax=Eubacterium callanderi TaxID=53442 RepID=E3GKG1_9FIRM|nr:hypothetical protein ELI_0896 [Eubacterium callanderi]
MFDAFYITQGPCQNEMAQPGGFGGKHRQKVIHNDSEKSF